MNRTVAIIIAVGVILIVGLAISLAVVILTNNKDKDVCFTRGCVEAASIIIKNINPEVEPCDNFYNFACGGYIASTHAPEGEISVDPFSVLGKDIKDQLKTILEEPSSPGEAHHFQLLKNFYNTCMNTSALEKAGLDPLYKILNQFGKWPVLSGYSWRENDFNWVQSIYRSRKLGYKANQFISLGISVDWSNNKKYILVLDQPSFGLTREYLAEGIDYFVVKAYYRYMVDIAVLLGANRQRATQELRESLDFELKLANISLPEEERRNYTLLNNQMTIREIQTRYPSVNWLEYFNNLLPSTIKVDADEIVMVKEPKFISGLEQLLRATPKRVQANYVVWRIVAESVPYLSKNVRDRELKYKSDMMGGVVASDEPRWKQCLSMTNDNVLALSLSALYVRKYFKEEARENVVEMVADIRKELIEVLKTAEWMDKVTRDKAIEKAESMLSHVAYPVELLDDNKLEEVYGKTELHHADFLGSIADLKPLELELTLGLLRKPVNKSDWITHEYSTEVNAFYDASENSIQIPAAILQGVFFGKDRPRYMNYGAMGFLIGHEMTHSFDTEGKQFDKDGNLVDWWTQETTRKYLEKAQCMVEQYSNYTVESVGLNVDGANTVSENIADNGGLQKAFRAYKEYVSRNGPEPILPGLNYTQEQMFWIHSASLWCISYRPEAAHYELTTDVHSPERFRVIGSVSNLPEFSDAFNCPAGSNMNPVHKCSVL